MYGAYSYHLTYTGFETCYEPILYFAQRQKTTSLKIVDIAGGEKLTGRTNGRKKIGCFVENLYRLLCLKWPRGKCETTMLC